jgi:hypothetical protein
MKINNLSLFDLDDYSLDRPTGDYDWENSELDRMYEQPPPKQRPPDDTRSILAICEWMRAQPNGHNLDLPDLELLPILEPQILREHFKNLLPIFKPPQQNSGLPPTGSPSHTARQDREQNREQSKTLLPIPENSGLPPTGSPSHTARQDREQNREQFGTDLERSHLVQTENDRKIVKVRGEAYIFQSTKSLAPINRLNGWIDIKPSPNKRHLYLCLRWREGTTQRSKHLGKVIKVV